MFKGYGLTESTVCLAAPPHTGLYKPGTVGEPVSLTELKVNNPGKTNKESSWGMDDFIPKVIS